MKTGNKKISRLVRRLRTIGKYRDSALAGIGLIYLLGYVVWFIVAYRRGLGPVPFLDTQYFIGGVVVFPMLASLLLILSALAWFFLWFLPAWVRTRTKKQLAWYMIFIVVGFAINSYFRGIYTGQSVPAYDSRFWLQPRRYMPPVLLDASLMIIAWECAIELIRKHIFRDMNEERWGSIDIRPRWCLGVPATILAAICLAWLGLAGIGFFINDIYVRIPAEFGGAKSRMARLSLARDSISPEIVRLLTGKPVTDPNEKVVSSKRIEVLLAGKDCLIVNPAPDDPNSRDRVEISRDAIKAIVWCPDREPAEEPVILAPQGSGR